MSEATKFVSRAGKKLEHALEIFEINVTGLVCADFGSSTGGFVDCLLQSGANKVYSVDTSYGELAWTLRNDERVVVMERTNAMHVRLPEMVDLITVDTSWTKQEKVLPNVLLNLKPDGKIISLIKPHYEATKMVKKGKLPDEKIGEVLDTVKNKIEGLGLKVEKITESPIVGGKGKNKEYLAFTLFR